MQNYSGEFLQIPDDRKNISLIFDSMKSYDYRGIILEKGGKYTFISKNYELINLKFEELKKFIKTAIDFSKSLELKIK
jgi:DNA-binding transcriptional regulator YhcF (GntR family)